MTTLTHCDSLKVEKLAEAHLLPYMERAWPGCTYYPTRHHELIQRFCGDVLVVRADNAKYIEIKAEVTNLHGNLFVETWSNLSRRNRGWIWKCQADWLWYYFVTEHQLYIMPMRTLQRWFYAHGNRYPEKKQGKYDQLNDTWGRCIPIADLQAGMSEFQGPVDPTEVTQ